MKTLLLFAIRAYWKLSPRKQAKCIFRETCSHHVYRMTLTSGFLSGLRALLKRFRQCRPHYFIVRNCDEICIILADGTLISCSETSTLVSEQPSSVTRESGFHRTRLITFLGVFVSVNFCWSADYLNEWVWRNPLPTGQHFESITHGNGLFAATFPGGGIYTSEDGTRWKLSHWEATNFSTSVSRSGERFLAIRTYNNYPWDGLLAASLDGITWTRHVISPHNGPAEQRYPSAVIHGANTYVVVGGGYNRYNFGVILTSKDLINWTQYAFRTNVNSHLSAVAYGNGRFVAASAGSGTYFTSLDAEHWQIATLGTNKVESIIYANSLFVAVGGSSISTSTDGQVWNHIFPAEGLTSVRLYAVTYGGGIFVAVGRAVLESNYTGLVLTSFDGINWTRRDCSTDAGLLNVAYGNGRFLAGGTGGLLFSSETGTTWMRRDSTVTTANFTGVAFGQGRFVAVGDAIATSIDGANWTLQRSNIPPRTVSSITFGNGKFVAVGWYGNVLTSPDGVTWTPRNSGATLYNITFGNGLYVGVGFAGAIVTSSNAVDWVARTSEASGSVSGITYGNGLFVATGGSKILTSSDGVNWIVRLSGTSAYEVCYGNGLFVAACANDCILTSRDGITWISRNIGPELSGVQKIIYGAGQFIAVACGGPPLLTSLNGLTWSQRIPAGLCLNSIAHDGSQFVAVGNTGTILQSGDPASRAPSIAASPLNQTSPTGGNVTFTVAATGSAPINYQWRKNGISVPGANNSTLTLDSVTVADSDCYSVVVWNSLGSVESERACLSVLADGANGIRPERVVTPPTPTQGAAIDSLVVITHGYEPAGPFNDVSWVESIAQAMRERIPANWVVYPHTWKETAFGIPPQALIEASIQGYLFAQVIARQNWEHVHLIGHSAGSGFVEAACRKIKTVSPETTVHTTFLDPYVGLAHEGTFLYGARADWADCYFAEDVLTGGFTAGDLDSAYNVDVSWLAPAGDRVIVPYGQNRIAFATHWWPHQFYLKTVREEWDWCTDAMSLGFAISKEAGGWHDRLNFPIGNAADPNVLCGPSGAIENPGLLRIGARLALDALQHFASAGAVVLRDSFTLIKNALPLNPGAFGETATAPIDNATWLAVAVPVTNSVNFVEFEAGFAGANGEGLLTVFWNTNQIGMVDQRVTNGPEIYRFALPQMVTNGLYTLSFRLDAFNNTASSIIVTNIATGFAGLEQPSRLDIVGTTNGTPTFKLTGAQGFNYLLQSSTNLADWLPTALLQNTNGTVFFSDSRATNSTSRFYRAVLP